MMGLAIYFDRRDEVDAVDATSTSGRDIIEASSKRTISNSSEILNEVNKIVRLYGSKEINVNEMMSIIKLYNLFDMIRVKTRQSEVITTSSTQNDSNALIARLEKITIKLEKAAQKKEQMYEKNS